MSYSGNGGICIICKVAPVDLRLDGRRRSYCKPCRRDVGLWRKYGITQKDVDRMMAEQGFACKICKEPKKLFVDHDHVTGKVRGLLCQRCNSMVGFIDKYIIHLPAALEYVKQGSAS